MWDGVSPESLKAHHTECGAKACAQCQWYQCGAAWRAASTLPQGQNEHSKQPWLAARLIDGQLRIGCIACCRKCSSKRNRFSNFDITLPIKSFRLTRHAKSADHIGAARKYVDAKPTKQALTEMQAHWKAAHEGRSFRDKGGVSSDKVCRMRWCLEEAVMETYRDFLKDAVSIVLMRDERKNRLLVRFSAVDADMNTLMGTLGQASMGATCAAESILEHTAEIVRIFCTRRVDQPRGSKLPAEELDAELLDHIRTHIEVIVSDAAASERLATEQGRGSRRPAGPAQEVWTPNLKLSVRDHAHAVKRTVLGGQHHRALPLKVTWKSAGSISAQCARSQ